MPNYNVLLVDDHPMIIAGFEQALDIISENNEEIKFKRDSAQNCTDAADYIMDSNQAYDLICLDLSLPGSKDGKYNSGEDLAKLARKCQSEAKLLICTMLENNYKVLNVMRRIDPDGFLVKSDTNPDILISAIENLLNGKTYQSATVHQMLKRTVEFSHNIDEDNLKILYLLSQGILTKNLPEHMGLSLSAIEKRKKQMKQFFDISNTNDKILLEKAKEKGFL
ncbi:response regulator [Psychroflexus sediminis]|uniref:DNA-binding response regulator, NarL/FixJ family, contains REC and HTH domains n=1 Tax=Psychroflexus sediminis TaxID=470826 RepID=A0A1G7U0Z7_9FLAO|nr:response regulator [Psychroflexus sediminis]SDG41272.1 DNA-binding response regulator, NarL/FixJ family, contains REC and HTH domains [Psychroflexus sediminis]